MPIFDMCKDCPEGNGSGEPCKLPICSKLRMHQLECNRCFHRWLPRSMKLPKVCPKCNSPYWNSPRIFNK